MILKLLAFGFLGLLGLIGVAVVVPVIIAGCLFILLCWIAAQIIYFIFPQLRPRVISLNDFEARLETHYALD